MPLPPFFLQEIPRMASPDRPGTRRMCYPALPPVPQPGKLRVLAAVRAWLTPPLTKDATSTKVAIPLTSAAVGVSRWDGADSSSKEPPIGLPWASVSLPPVPAEWQASERRKSWIAGALS